MVRKNASLIIVLTTVICLLLSPLAVLGGSKMPPFSLKNVINGQIVNSKDLADKVVFIAFFATWCPPCRSEAPSLVKAQKKYSGKGFTVIGMAMDMGKTKDIKAFIEEFSINYPVVIPDYNIIQQYGGIYSLPTSFLVDRKGNVVKMYRGAVSYRELTKDLESVL